MSTHLPPDDGRGRSLRYVSPATKSGIGGAAPPSAARRGGVRSTVLGAAALAILGTAGGMPVAAARGTASTAESLVLRAGEPAEIVRAGRAAEPVREAAAELQRILRLAGFGTLPIVLAPRSGWRHIFVGDQGFTRRVGIEPAKNIPDSYRMTVIGRDIALVGTDDDRRAFFLLDNDPSASGGTYFAVVDFARRFIGARWFMPGPLGEDIPRVGAIRLPPNLDEFVRPRFAVRYVDVASSKTFAQEDSYRRQGYVHGHYLTAGTIEAAQRWGRHLRLGTNAALAFEHSWYRWLPAEQPSAWSPDTYGRAHPEYYAIPGGRGGRYYYGTDGLHGGQLCVFRADVAAAMARSIISYGRRTGQRTFSLSPNDGDWECTSACCGTDGGPHGAGLTAAVAVFSNAVAAQVLQALPDARFGLYAYHWTAEPPAGISIDPRIEISDVYNGLPYEYELASRRARVEELIRRWRESASSVTLTTYYMFDGHYSMPWSTPRVEEWLVGLIRDHESSTGIRFNFDPLDAAPVGVLGPDPWLVSEWLWDPSLPREGLVADYYAHAFGPRAGELLKRYFDRIAAAMSTAVTHQPYREVNGVPGYLATAYAGVRAECAQLMHAALEEVAMAPAGIRWRVERVARGWELAEATLDVLDAARAGNALEQQAAERRRRALLDDPQSAFALAPASVDVMETELPLATAAR